MPRKDKEKRREYDRKWYLAHLDERRERSRNYRLSHKEKIREYNRNYRLAHREEIGEYDRNCYLSHKEQGLCVKCDRKAIPGLTLCIQCWYKRGLFMKRYWQENRQALSIKNKERYKRWKEEGKCPGCGAPLIEEEIVCCVNCNIGIWKDCPYSRGRLYEVNYETVASKS